LRHAARAMKCLADELRFLRWTGVIDEDLSRFLPRVACWQM